jgi:hypothetical protein
MFWIGLLLNPAILCLLVWIVAGSTADFYVARMFFIAVAVGLVGGVLGTALGAQMAVLALVPMACILVFLLMKYCGVALKQAVLITCLYFAFQLFFVYVLKAATK